MALKKGTVYIDSLKGEEKKSEAEVSENSKFDELIKRAGFIIFEISSKHSPFSLIRSKLVIAPNRITIIKRGLFYTDEYPMPIENVTDAMVYTHMFSASLMIETFGIPKPDPLKNLIVNEARLARRYILGLIECKKAGIDLSGMDITDLRQKLKSIGTVRYGSESKKYHEGI